MFNVQESLHRSPYEELQSINEDGTIIALTYNSPINIGIWADYTTGRLFDDDLFKEMKYWTNDFEPNFKNEFLNGLRFPTDFDFGLFVPFGYSMTRYIINNPSCSWLDVYNFLIESIKEYSYWKADDDSEGLLLLISTPLHVVRGKELLSYRDETDSRIYTSKVLAVRDYIVIHWTADEILEMGTAINENGYPFVSYHFGDSFTIVGETQKNEPYFVGGEWLNLCTMLKPLSFGITNHKSFKAYVHWEGVYTLALKKYKEKITSIDNQNENNKWVLKEKGIDWVRGD